MSGPFAVFSVPVDVLGFTFIMYLNSENGNQ